MEQIETPLPKVVSRDEWRTERLKHLEHEKEVTRHRDRVSAERRRLPMVALDKEYIFDGPEGKRSLLDLFGNCRQLIIYHFMFDPEWDTGCGGCTGYVDALGDLSMLGERDTTFALVSRAPLAKLEAYKAGKGWSVPWYSSFGSNFNYDFHVTLDARVAPVEYNYRASAQMAKPIEGEEHGMSVFFVWGTLSSTLTPHTHAAPKTSPILIICLTSPLTAGRKIGRTHRRAGLRSQLTGNADTAGRGAGLR